MSKPEVAKIEDQPMITVFARDLPSLSRMAGMYLENYGFSAVGGVVAGEAIAVLGEQHLSEAGVDPEDMIFALVLAKKEYK